MRALRNPGHVFILEKDVSSPVNQIEERRDK